MARQRSEVQGARMGRRGSRRGRRSGRSRGDRRGDTGPGPPSGVPSAVVAGLEVDEVPGGVGRPPPADELVARPEREAGAARRSLEQQVVEAVERVLERLGRAPANPLPRRRHQPARRRAGRRRPRRLRGRGSAAAWTSRCGRTRRLVDAAAAASADPVARRLDLLDRTKPAARIAFAVGLVRGRDLGIRGHDVDAVRGEARRLTRSRRAASAAPSAADRRPARAGCTRSSPRSSGHGRSSARTRPPSGEHEEPRPPARRPARCVGPGPRLVDVAAGRIDGRGVPVLELGRRRLATARSLVGPRPAAPRAPVAPDARGAAGPSRTAAAARAASYAGAPERVEDEVPGADVADLAATEPGLEVGDPAGREAPQVVARRALLPRRCGSPPT